MATARDIIKTALRKIHVLGVGSSLSNEEANDALSTLNDMLAVWSAEGNLVYSETIETFNLTANVGEYTIGSGGTFNTTRPIQITSAYVTEGSYDYSLERHDSRQYANITDKSTQGTPEIYYYNADYALAKIFLYPVPTTGTITLYSEKPLTAFTSLDTAFAMPEEYKAALIYNLAVWLAPEYEREPSMSVTKLANRTKKVVVAQNSKNDKYVSTFDIPSSEQDSRSFDIYRGY